MCDTLTCGSSSGAIQRLFTAYSLIALLFSVLTSTVNVFSLSMGLIGPNGLLYLLYVRYLLADWFSDWWGDIAGLTSIILCMLGLCGRRFGLTNVRESNLCLSDAAAWSGRTKMLLSACVNSWNNIFNTSTEVKDGVI